MEKPGGSGLATKVRDRIRSRDQPALAVDGLQELARRCKAPEHARLGLLDEVIGVLARA